MPWGQPHATLRTGYQLGLIFHICEGPHSPEHACTQHGFAPCPLAGKDSRDTLSLGPGTPVRAHVPFGTELCPPPAPASVGTITIALSWALGVQGSQWYRAQPWAGSVGSWAGPEGHREVQHVLPHRRAGDKQAGAVAEWPAHLSGLGV